MDEPRKSPPRPPVFAEPRDSGASQELGSPFEQDTENAGAWQNQPRGVVRLQASPPDGQPPQITVEDVRLDAKELREALVRS